MNSVSRGVASRNGSSRSRSCRAKALTLTLSQRERELRPLKQEPQGQLQLPRITHALPQEAIEVKETRCGQRALIAGYRQRVDAVIVVEGVEHLHRRDQLVTLAEFERPRQPPVEREVVVVLAQAVAVRRRLWRRRGRLGRT